jgi:hypothetical protein
MADILLSEPTGDALWVAANSAQPGDRIQCPSGDYGAVGLPAGVLHAAPFVTLEPAEGADPVFTTLGISGQEATPTGGYIVQGFDIRMTPATQYGVYTGWARDVVVRRNRIHQADDQTPSGTGVWVRNSIGVEVYENEVYWVGDGIDGAADRQGACDGLNVALNALHDIGANFMFFSGVSHLAVLHNYGADARVIPGVHPDFCQIANSAGSVSEDVDIIENEYERGEGDVSQGIFIGDGRRIRVLRNAIRGAQTNGISVSNTKTIEVAENFVQPYGDIGSSILVRNAADDVKLIDNWAYVAVGVPGETQPTNVVNEGNEEVPPATGSDDTTEYDQWKASLGPAPGPDPCAAEKARIAELEQQLAEANAKIVNAQAALA